MDIIKNVIGTDIHIDDSNGDEIVDLELLGQTSQETTTGKNLFNVHSGTTVTSANVQFTRNANGTITINGTSNNIGYVEILYAFQNGTTQQSTPTLSLDTSKGYAISFVHFSGTTTSIDTRFVYQTNSAGNQNTLYPDNNVILMRCDGIYRAYLRIPSGVTFNNYVVGIQVEQGSPTDFEPYTGGATPRPDYPQPIKTVTGRQVVSVCKINKVGVQDGTYTLGNLTFSITDGVIEFNGTTDTATRVFYIPLKNPVYLKNGETNTFYVKTEGTTNNQVAMRLLTTNVASDDNSFARTYFTARTNNTNSRAYTQVKDQTFTYLLIQFNANQTINFKSYIQLNSGSSVLDYEEYKCNAYEINLGKNLFKFDDISGTKNGLTYSVSNGEISISGTSTYSSAFGVFGESSSSKLPILEKGETYTLSTTTPLTGLYVQINYYKEGTTTQAGLANQVTNSITFTVPNDFGRVAQVFVGSLANFSGNYTFSIQLEKGSVATSFTPYKTPIYLGEIGNYQDYIFRNTTENPLYDSNLEEGQWYIHKEMGRVVLNGSEPFQSYTEGFTITQSGWNDLTNNNCMSKSIILSNYYKNYTTYADLVAQSYGIGLIYSVNNLYIRNTDITSVANFKTWLASNNVEVYYVLNTPTNTLIEDEELINQLNALKGATLPEGTVNINVNGDLPVVLDLDYFTTDRYISPEDRESLLDGSATIPFKINVIKDGEIIKTLTERSIVNIDYEDYRYVDTSSLVIGQFVARKINGTLDQIYTEFEIEDTELEIQMGISYGGTTNYYSLGNFLVTKPTNDDVKDKTTFEAMDYTKKFNKVFDPSGLEFPCTALDLARYTCELCGVELGTTGFANANFVIENNQYVEKETCRKVMQDIGKLAYSWVRIDWDNKCYIDFNVGDTIATENVITNTEYYDLSLQKEVFGPVNRVVIGMEGVEGENAVIEDPDSIEEHGVTEIQLYDNNLTYTPELRFQVIEEARRLFGLTYTPLETNTIGHPWLIGKEKIEMKDMDNNSIYTYPWDRTISYKGHIKSKITSKADTKTETEYRNYGEIENEVRKTRLIVDKNNGDITLLTSRTDSLEKDTYTKEQVNELVQNAQTGLTNTFTEAGGNNIFRNTGLWFENSGNDSQQNPYEFWSGLVVRTKEDKASNLNALLLQNSTLIQEQDVPNGNYVVSFKYKKLLTLTNAKVYINDVEYTLDETEDTEFIQVIETNSQHINVKFTCDIDGGCEVYDLMVNAGQVKLAYSQNQNETTTDTVNISKGITITSSDTKTTFKADSTGIKTLDENGNRLTEFTDTGMVTKEATIESKSQIVGTLWQEVAGQTWITKL